jgi:signal transduction histidine kinase
VTLADPADPVVVRAGEDAVVRMLDNLLSNADRHAATAVRVSVCAEDGAGTVTVSDDGPGIPAAERSRVFERFARLDGSRAQDSGGQRAGAGHRPPAGPVVRRLGRAARRGAGVRAVVRLPLAVNRR